VKSAAATNLSFLYFLVRSSHEMTCVAVSVQLPLISPPVQEKDYDQADRYADLAVTADRYNPAAIINKANIMFVKQDYEKAGELYKEALRNDSSCTEALFNLGTTAGE